MVVLEPRIGEKIFLRGGRLPISETSYTYHTSRKILEHQGVEVSLLDLFDELHKLANRHEDSYDRITVRSI